MMSRPSREVLEERKLWLAPLEDDIHVRQADSTYLRRAGNALFNCRHFLREFTAAGLKPRISDGVFSLCNKAIPIQQLMAYETCDGFIETLHSVEDTVRKDLESYYTTQSRYLGRLMEYQIEGSLLEARLYCCPPNTAHTTGFGVPCVYNLWDNEFICDDFNFQEHWPYLNYEKPRVKSNAAIRRLIRG